MKSIKDDYKFDKVKLAKEKKEYAKVLSDGSIIIDDKRYTLLSDEEKASIISQLHSKFDDACELLLQRKMDYCLKCKNQCGYYTGMSVCDKNMYEWDLMVSQCILTEHVGVLPPNYVSE